MKIWSWRQYPICILGFDIRCWENTFRSAYFQQFVKKFLFWKKIEGLGPHHLQNWSPFGFLLTWPLCFHAWYQFKEQLRDRNGNSLSGTEIIFYFRIGIAQWYSIGMYYKIPTFYIGFKWY